MERTRSGMSSVRAALGLGLVLSSAGCGTIRMAEIALADDRTARVESAWRTDDGGLALLLDGVETNWSEGEALLPLSKDELEQALASEGAATSDLAALPVVFLPRSRLVRGWSSGGSDGPTLAERLPVDRIGRRDWGGGVPPGTDEAGGSIPLRIVYRVDYPAPGDDHERLLACMVMSTEAPDGRVRRAVFVVEGLDKGFFRVAALIGVGVVVDLAILALLVA